LVVYTTIAATTAGAISVTNGTITTSPAAAVDRNIQTAYGAGNTVIGFDRDNNGVDGRTGSKVIAVGVKPEFRCYNNDWCPNTLEHLMHRQVLT
jgi:hypothetical protein